MLLKLCRLVALSAACTGCAQMLCSTAYAAPPLNLPGFKAKSASLDGQPGVFPTVAAEALDGTAITLPAGLAGRNNLLLLSWARDQFTQLDTWTAAAQALQHTHFDFRIYRMPVSAPENFIYRWWDNASLRAAEMDSEQLHWCVPLYMEKASLHRALGIAAAEQSVVVLLVDHSGRILWKAQGASTATSRASLQAAEAANR